MIYFYMIPEIINNKIKITYIENDKIITRLYK